MQFLLSFWNKDKKFNCNYIQFNYVVIFTIKIFVNCFQQFHDFPCHVIMTANWQRMILRGKQMEKITLTFVFGNFFYLLPSSITSFLVVSREFISPWQVKTKSYINLLKVICLLIRKSAFLYSNNLLFDVRHLRMAFVDH